MLNNSNDNELDYKVDAAIFADTQAEFKDLYKWLDWLEKEILTLPHSVPIYKVSKGDEVA